MPAPSCSHGTAPNTSQESKTTGGIDHAVIKSCPRPRETAVQVPALPKASHVTFSVSPGLSARVPYNEENGTSPSQKGDRCLENAHHSGGVSQPLQPAPCTSPLPKAVLGSDQRSATRCPAVPYSRCIAGGRDPYGDNAQGHAARDSARASLWLTETGSEAAGTRQVASPLQIPGEVPREFCPHEEHRVKANLSGIGKDTCSSTPGPSDSPNERKPARERRALLSQSQDSRMP